MFTKIQVSILKSLARNEQSLAELSRSTRYSKPSLIAQLNNLERQGWIQRHHHSAKKISFSLLSIDTFTEHLGKTQGAVVQDIFAKPEPQGGHIKLVSGFRLNLSAEQRQILTSNFDFAEYPETQDKITEELFLIRYKDADIAIIDFSFSFLTQATIKQCKKLKHIIYLGKFAKHYIDESIVTNKHITWWDLSRDDVNYIRNSSSEFLLMATLSLLRPMSQAEQDIKLTGRSDAALRADYSGDEIWGKTIGIIGVENSSRLVAPIFRSLGANLMLADPAQTHTDPFAYHVDRFHSVADLFARADVVIYTDNYYKTAPKLEDYLTDSMRTRYLLVLGEYTYNETFMKTCREQILKRNLIGLHLDYWSTQRFNETPAERKMLLSEVMHFPHVRVTPFIGPSSQQAIMRRNNYLIDILRTIIGAAS